MFYKMIENKCTQWYESEQCTVKNLIEYTVAIDKNSYVIVDGNKTKKFWDGCIRNTKKPLRLKIRNICGDETVWEEQLAEKLNVSQNTIAKIEFGLRILNKTNFLIK